MFIYSPRFPFSLIFFSKFIFVSSEIISISEIVVTLVPHDIKGAVCSDDMFHVKKNFDRKLTFNLILKFMSKSQDILPTDIAVADSNSFFLMHDDSCINASHSRLVFVKNEIFIFSVKICYDCKNNFPPLF